MKEYCKILSIAGSDSGGGAGIQADIKAISACGCYAMTAITALTAQNTLGVNAIHPVPADMVREQIIAVFSDIGADAVKTGMLFSADIVEAAAGALKETGAANLVVDPVMVATAGSRLIENETIPSMINLLFPLASLITPNIPEAEAILGREIKTQADLDRAAKEMSDISGSAILLKGGHFENLREIVDVLYEPSSGFSYYKTPYIDTQNTHGTGCVLSAAIASHLGKGKSIREAVAAAKKYLDGALRAGAEYRLGRGCGPLHHFYEFQ